MRVWVQLWHSKGLKSVVYLDDGICASVHRKTRLKHPNAAAGLKRL